MDKVSYGNARSGGLRGLGRVFKGRGYPCSSLIISPWNDGVVFINRICHQNAGYFVVEVTIIHAPPKFWVLLSQHKVKLEFIITNWISAYVDILCG